MDIKEMGLLESIIAFVAVSTKSGIVITLFAFESNNCRVISSVKIFFKCFSF